VAALIANHITIITINADFTIALAVIGLLTYVNSPSGTT
jgi:hypothetical protein